MKKYIRSILVTTLFVGLSTLSYSQKVVQDTITVQGICEMCQERIEEAAYGKGVKFVSWDKHTKNLAIAFNKEKTTLEEVEKRILAAGHSTQNFLVKREDYNELPDCCRYETLHTH